jgi:hypothetical protein
MVPGILRMEESLHGFSFAGGRGRVVHRPVRSFHKGRGGSASLQHN